MKKEDSVSLLVYVLMIVIAIVVGISFLSPIFKTYGYTFPGNGSLGMLFALVFVLGAIIINVIFIEVFHIIGAKAGGYSVFSVNFLWFCFYRKANNKWGFKFSSFDGLTGETKIAPVKDNANPKAFALFPLFFYILEFVGCMIGLYTIESAVKARDIPNSMMLWNVLFIILVTVGGMIELYNIFPAKLDSSTDGYRLVILSKKENIEAYNELMKVIKIQSEGKEPENLKVFENITDFTAQLNLYSVYRHFDKGEFDQAEEILDKIIASKSSINKLNYHRVLAQKLFLVILNKPFEDANKYYEEFVDNDSRRFIANELSMESIRAYLLISGILDKSEAEARFAISRKNKALKRTLSGRVNVENKLYDQALNFVDRTHPEWEITKEQKTEAPQE